MFSSTPEAPDGVTVIWASAWRASFLFGPLIIIELQMATLLCEREISESNLTVQDVIRHKVNESLMEAYASHAAVALHSNNSDNELMVQLGRQT